jgi:hypothetical protein
MHPIGTDDLRSRGEHLGHPGSSLRSHISYNDEGSLTDTTFLIVLEEVPLILEDNCLPLEGF